MKPANRHILKRNRSNKMIKHPETKTEEVKLPAWRQFVKDNKTKILAVVGVLLSAIGGDAVGITDFISAWFF